MTATYRLLKALVPMLTLILLAVTLLVAGCGEDSSEYICEPGALQPCPCVGGGDGVQKCAEGRQGWEECQCAPSAGKGEDEGETSAK